MSDVAPEHRYSVAVDFDGVIHSYTTPWIDCHVIPDPPVEGAIEWLNDIVDRFDLIVHTTRGRTPAGCEAIRQWLDFHGFKHAWHADVKVTHEKLPALVYVDDRGWRFEGPGTFPTADEIHRALPWHKR